MSIGIGGSANRSLPDTSFGEPVITTRDGPASMFAVVAGRGAHRGGSLPLNIQGLMDFLGERAFFGVRTFGARLGGSLSGLPGSLASLQTVWALIDGGGSVN